MRIHISLLGIPLALAACHNPEDPTTPNNPTVGIPDAGPAVSHSMDDPPQARSGLSSPGANAGTEPGRATPIGSATDPGSGTVTPASTPHDARRAHPDEKP